MNSFELVSCRSCGIVYDANAVGFASKPELYHPDGTVDDKKARENKHGIIVPYVKCRICTGDVIADCVWFLGKN